ncbi:unnamed protein product, partial [marine sediment metagenome]
DILKRLFPKIEEIYGNPSYQNTRLSEWRKNKRICSPDIFERFFGLNIPISEISQQEMETLLSLANSTDTFTDALLSLNRDGRIVRFLDLMEDYTESDIIEDNIENIITVLMDIGDLFPDDEIGFLQMGTSMRILRIFHQLSQRFSSEEKRFEIFSNAIKKADRSLYILTHEVGVQGQQHGKYGLKEKPDPEEKRTISSKHLPTLEKLALGKIKAWANDGRLIKHKKLVPILYDWQRWGSTQEVKQYVNSTVSDDEGLVHFITGFLSKSISHGMGMTGMPDYVGRTKWYINMKNVKNFIDVDKISPRVRKIHESQRTKDFDDEKKLALKIFLDSVDGKIQDEF